LQEKIHFNDCFQEFTTFEFTSSSMMLAYMLVVFIYPHMFKVEKSKLCKKEDSSSNKWTQPKSSFQVTTFLNLVAKFGQCNR
jgi:ACR3 family arsenite efflux pump ArsB